MYYDFTGKGIPIRHVLGKSKMLLGLLEGIPTMFKGEIAVVNYLRICFCSQCAAGLECNICYLNQ